MISSMRSTPGPGRSPLSRSIQECIVDAAERLDKAGIPDPTHESRALFQHASGWTLTELMSRLAEPAAPGLESSVAALLTRRLAREPLQYVTGSAWFYGRVFHSDHRALVPRPETEILVERVVDLLSRAVQERPRILDVGTGTGIVAVTLALELPQAVVDAVDISGEAVALARHNVVTYGLQGRVNLLCCDLGAPLRRVYDAVVANPPYIPTTECAYLQPEVRLWEPVIALDGGADGLTVTGRLMCLAPLLLRPGGVLALECGAGQAGDVGNRLQTSGQWTHIRLTPDLAGIPRVVTARLASRQPVRERLP
jgi:release factor glutamine methyltransferase